MSDESQKSGANDEWMALLQLGNAQEEEGQGPSTDGNGIETKPGRDEDPSLKHLLQELVLRGEVGSIEPGTSGCETSRRCVADTNAVSLHRALRNKIQMELDWCKCIPRIRASRLMALDALDACDSEGRWMAVVDHALHIIEDEKQRLQPAQFKVGICASPCQRFTSKSIGYQRDGYEMNLLVVADSSVVVKLEKHFTRTLIGTEGCLNEVLGGGGRCPHGCPSFLYVAVKKWKGTILSCGAQHGPPAVLECRRKRRKRSAV